MGTIHIIPNAHIDPVWLWPWQAGLDAAIATCRSACERLESHPELTFCQGEAWVFRGIQLCDPELFERIRGHIASGRWNVVGGWWIQPDCNGPSGWAMERQIGLGLDYCQGAFGVRPRCGYNVDTFGHAATLPTLMHAHGQDRYVMMRPGSEALPLPARLYRWRERSDGPEVITFRIAPGYNGGGELAHLRSSLTELPRGCEHTMCFIGVGDHGGGPTERQLALLASHGGMVDGWNLAFSTPDRFFDAVARSGIELPVVSGELQPCAIGCYSVHREVKCGVRRAEHLLVQAEQAQAVLARRTGAIAEPTLLREAWELVCFNHFHDTYGGTCIPSANRQSQAQLGRALALADETAHRALRCLVAQLPGDPCQQLVLLNASDTAYEGLVELEPWLEWLAWAGHWRLLDEQDRALPLQLVESEYQTSSHRSRLLVHLTAKPGELRVLRIDRRMEQPPARAPAALQASTTRIVGVSTVDLARSGSLVLEGWELPLPRLELYEDPSDTWSHGLVRYQETSCASAQWEAPQLMDRGPLMASLVCAGRIGESRLLAQWRVFAELPWVELHVRVQWSERRRVLKLVVPLTGGLAREDGIMGGAVERVMNGAELPLRDRTLVRTGSGTLGVVAVDCFAIDATPERLRLTLLRAPAVAHHEPHPGDSPLTRFTDQGEHDFRILFRAGPGLTGASLDAQALTMQRPLLFADATRGMRCEP